MVEAAAAARGEMARQQALAKQVEEAKAETAAAQAALAATESAGHEDVQAVQKTLDTTTAEMRDLRTQNEMLLGQLDKAMNSMATEGWTGGTAAADASNAEAADGAAEEDGAAVVEGLREVVKSLRRGREMAEARLELAQQQAQRGHLDSLLGA